MKIITLNIWGGKLKDPLFKFLKHYSPLVDIFCFQEIYSSKKSVTNNKGMHLNIFEQICKILPNHQEYYASSYKLNNQASTGLAIFASKKIVVKSVSDLFIFGKRTNKQIINYQNAPRNLQYFTFEIKDQRYLLCHFHGIWHPKTKLDTSQRILQTEKIRNFLRRHKESIILCGDFNLLPDTKSISILEKGMINLVKEYNITTTRNSYYGRDEKFADYFLTSPEIGIKNFKVLKDSVSDHLPLLLEI